MRQLSLSWNAASGQYIARYKEFGTGTWKTKRIPKNAAGRGEQFKAERWLEGWYGQHLRTGGLNAQGDEVALPARTIKTMAPKWLKLREDDPGTAINTHYAFTRIVKNWVLDTPRFSHASIQDLDMATDFSPSTCLVWIKSMNLKAVTKVRYIDCLKTMFRDSIVQGWLPEEQVNPFDHLRVLDEIKRLRREAEGERRTSILNQAQVQALLVERNSKVSDYRRVRYVVALGTGLRDMELQGLTWEDLHLDATIPYLWVWRQLLKPGPGPFVLERDLHRQGHSKNGVRTHHLAVMKDPKRRSKRAVPLHPLVVETLRTWKVRGWGTYVGRKAAPADPVFPSGIQNGHRPRGQFCTSESAQLLRQDLERLGKVKTYRNAERHVSESLDFHAVRRTFATMLADEGVPSDEIGELLGHGAVDTASKHYIRRAVKARHTTILKLPLPDRVELWAGTVRRSREKK